MEESGQELQIRLLGPMELRAGDRSLPLPASARARALLVHLVLRPDQDLPRRSLAALMWPDSTEGQSRTNLRNVLHLLRRTCAEIDRQLVVGSEAVRWPGRGVWVDARAFEAAAVSADPDALRAAAQLYRGDLLEALDDPSLERDRARLRDLHRTVLGRLARTLLEHHRPGEAVPVARELVRLDPLDEAHHRLLIESLRAAGDRPAAMHAYHECASLLRRELDVEPDEATRRLAEELTGAPTEHVAAGSTLLGRDRPWAVLTSTWISVESGSNRFAVVSGEAGIGKTRLAEELARWCARRGAIVGRARSYSSEGDLGYGVIVAWLRSPGFAPAISAIPPADRAALAGILPELAEGSGAPGVTDRHRLFDAVSRVVSRAARPVLLLADDVQWCDQPSLELVHFLLRTATGSVMVLATIRHEDLDDSSPASQLMSGLLALEGTVSIGLDRLEQEETRQLAEDMGLSVRGGAAAALYAETEGNPLFVVESVRAGWRPGRPGTPTPRMRAVIAQRLQRLTPATRELLGVAATLGREFTADLLQRAAAVDEQVLVTGLDELWRRGVLRASGTDSYDFSHGKLREAAYQALSPAVRRQHHLNLADILQTSDAEAASGRIAAHYDRAGRPDPAVDWYLRAAVAAHRRYADREAVAFLRRAHELLAILPPDPTRELEVLTLLPVVLVEAEGYASPSLSHVQDRAIDVAAAAGVDVPAEVLRSRVMTYLCEDRFDLARQAAERLRDDARRGHDFPLEVESEYLLGIAAFWSGDLGYASDQFRLVIERFDPAHRMEHLYRFGQDSSLVCLSRLANALWFLGDAEGAAATRDRAVRAAEEVAHPFTSHVVRVFAAMLAVDLREDAKFRRFAGGFGDPLRLPRTLRLNALAMRGYADVLTGGDGIGHIRAALEQSEGRNPAPGFRATISRLLVGAYDRAHDPAGGLRAADEALALPGTRLWEPEIRRLRARFARETVAKRLPRHSGATPTEEEP